jgi:hypothetical protein
MCLEAIWGFNVETLTCAGYDHNWVRGYAYEDGYQPLLPKGTILHIVGYMDNTPNNTNVPDPRNWQGSGNRSVANMFIDLGMQVAMTDEEFMAEMAERRERFGLTKNDHVIGCPLCLHTIDVPVPVRDDGNRERKDRPAPFEERTRDTYESDPCSGRTRGALRPGTADRGCDAVHARGRRRPTDVLEGSNGRPGL